MTQADHQEDGAGVSPERHAPSSAPDQQHSDEAPRREADWLRVTLASIGDAVISTDASSRVTFMNRVAEQLTGWTQADAAGRELSEVFRVVNERSREPVENPALGTLRDGVIVNLADDTVLIARDGTERPIEDSAAPIRDERGALGGCVLVFRDVSARRLAERALSRAQEESERHRRLYSAILGSTPDFVYVFDLAHRFIYANPVLLKVWGRTWEDAIGKTCLELGYEPWHAAMHDREIDQVIATRQPIRGEVPFNGTFGRRIYDYIFVPVLGAGGEVEAVAGTTRDITDRKLAEETLRESEERFRTLADNMSQFAWTADARGSIYWYNRRWFDYTGTTLEEMRDQGWRKVHHPEHAERVAASLGRSFESGNPWEDTFPIRGKDGGYRWYLSRAVPIQDEARSTRRWLGTHTDITEQREVEQELARHKLQLENRVEERTRELVATHEQLRTAERMASMGALAAGLGHDMANLLLPVRVRLDSLEELVVSEQGRDDLRAIRTSAEYFQKLANGLRLLALDPGRSLGAESTELSAWWADAQGVMRSVLPRGVSLEAEMPEGACYPGISKAALTQVVFNLVQNAGDAMKERQRGHVRVRAWPEGDVVNISVADDGPGMSDEVKARCMEPFFTTKARAISTGLGLVLVYGLVREVGGRVELDSEAGRGTTFTLRLPAVRASAAGRTGSARAKCAVVGLSDARLRSFVTGELRTLGFEVVDRFTRTQEAGLMVLDGSSSPTEIPETARVIFLGDEPAATRANTRALGSRPPIRAIREAIHQAAAELGRSTGEGR